MTTSESELTAARWSNGPEIEIGKMFARMGRMEMGIAVRTMGIAVFLGINGSGVSIILGRILLMLRMMC
jgi:hypothetical protein